MGISATTLLAGCSAIQHAVKPPEQPTARIEKMQLINRDSDTHRFTVQIETNGSVTYEKSHKVPSAGTAPVPVLFDELPQEAGRQRVSVGVNGTGEGESMTYDENTCYSIIIEYEEGQVGFFSASGDKHCRTSKQ
ncbi:hypothetical protein ACFQH3_16445 [Haladaptatus sp. GCM10025707]|uniref:hypothetical protein n=1 Tax=Haladaptatus sp. GCM10025707 TaxID=3252658 RepID=UPI003611AFCA